MNSNFLYEQYTLTTAINLPSTRKNDWSSQVSKARLIRHYASVVETDLLPAPFNLLQWAFSCPMFMVDWCCSTNLRKDTKRFFGRAVFWVIIGPIAVATGWFLWILSVPMMVTVVWRASAGRRVIMKLTRVTIAVACCIVGAPFWLLFLWVNGGLAGIWRMFVRLRRRGKRVCCCRGGRSKILDESGGFPFSNHYGDAVRNSRHEGGDVVKTVLNRAGRGA